MRPRRTRGLRPYKRKTPTQVGLAAAVLAIAGVALWQTNPELAAFLGVPESYPTAALNLGPVESEVFQEGGAYDWLPDPTPEALDGAELWESHDVLWSSGYASSQVLQLPDSMSWSSYVANDGQAPWGEHGPKWGSRIYNVAGSVEGNILSRVGDFTAGREGHGHYWNLAGPTTVTDCRVEWSGAQAWQITMRPFETKIHPDDWVQGMLTFDRCVAYQCGVINSGGAVRASWPFAIYAPGGSVVMRDCEVYTRHPQTFGPAPGFRSHGGVFIGPAATAASADQVAPMSPDAFFFADDWVRWQGGYTQGDTFQAYFRTPSAFLEDLVVDVWDSDREELHFRNVGVITLVRPDIRENDGARPADIVVVEDCGSFEIVAAVSAVEVHITSVASPHKTYGAESYSVPAGGSFYWEGE